MRNGCAQVRKAPAPRQPKKELGRLEAPEEVEVPEDEKKDPAVKNMEDMHAALLQRPGHCANVLACTVNHASFSQSVENFFALSFLVRACSGRAALSMGETPYHSWTPCC